MTESRGVQTQLTEERRTILVRVGEHECVTCQRCACTFAIVHQACPRCSEEFRSAALADAYLAAQKALRSFGMHRPECALNPYQRGFTDEEEREKCDCGFIAAIGTAVVADTRPSIDGRTLSVGSPETRETE